MEGFESLKKGGRKSVRDVSCEIEGKRFEF